MRHFDHEEYFIMVTKFQKFSPMSSLGSLRFQETPERIVDESTVVIIRFLK
jgi:hypothetical protein